MSRAGFALALLDLILLAWWRARTSGRIPALRRRVKDLNRYARLADEQCAELTAEIGRCMHQQDLTLAERSLWMARCYEAEALLGALVESSPVRGPGGRFAKKAAD